MSVEQENVIDFVGIEKESGRLILSISDHLPWDDNQDYHIKVLQKKIYKYLDYIESDQVKIDFPNIDKKNIIINVGYKYALNKKAEEFYKFVSNIIEDEGVGFSYKLFIPTNK